MLYQAKETIKKITPKALISVYHLILSFLGALFYGFPSRKLIVIGVTGTNGKSTVIDLITRILEQAGYKIASFSSIAFKIGGQEQPNMLKMTMPGRWQLQKLLRQAVKAKCKYAVLEVTSEGIKQHRHRFIKFNTAVFTNLSPEHIEAHGGFEKYRSEKLKLFKSSNSHIINADDENSEYFLKIPAIIKYLYSVNPGLKIDWKLKIGNWKFIKANNLQILKNGVSFSINNMPFNLQLLGRFNIYNALSAISIAISQGINLETCKNALEQATGIPGRMEKVISSPFEVFVDYAFTPNALKKVYQTLAPKNRKQKTENKLICVLGACGGGRDKWKRPVLGQIANNYCNYVIVTNEDPYDENPLEIINQVAKDCPKAEKILDRRQAIKKALTIAKPNDKVIITGKGCEPWICVAGNKKIPWDDRQVVREEMPKNLKTN